MAVALFRIDFGTVLPLLIFMLYSKSSGGLWLPDSILLKGVIPFLNNDIGLVKYVVLKTFYGFLRAPWVASLVVFGMGAFFFRPKVRKGYRDYKTILIILFLGTAVLHMTLASVGWFYRYEAYVVALGLFALWQNTPDFLSRAKASPKSPKMIILFGLIFLLSFPLFSRAYKALGTISTASKNMYDQHFTLARFLKKHYKNQPVLLNDIGILTLYGQVRSVDLVGIGNNKVARSILKKNYTTKTMEQLASKSTAEIAVIYDHVFSEFKGLPDSWKKIGLLRIQNNVVAGSDSIGLYAFHQASAALLREQLFHFQSDLPSGVTLLVR